MKRSALLGLTILIGACGQLDAEDVGDSIDVATSTQGLDSCTPGLVGECDGVLTFSDGSTFPYYRSQPVTWGGSNIRQALIIVHGVGRDPERYFDIGVDAAAADGKLGETIVIAPYFQQNAVRSTDLCWMNNRWSAGGDDSCFGGVTSFDVIDRIMNVLRNRSLYPYLHTITLAGHSAGGQFTQRFALVSGTQPSGVWHRYVVANPSSYAYLGRSRWLDSRTWGTPTSCPPTSDQSDYQLDDYNEWRYGLLARWGYATRISSSTAVSSYLPKNVIYLLGEDDTLRTDNLDVSCPADLQGSNRLSRGIRFWNYLNYFHSSHVHHMERIAGVGHDGRGMFTSAIGIEALFR